MKMVPEKSALSFTLIMVSSLIEIHFNIAQYIDFFSLRVAFSVSSLRNLF